MTRRRGYLWLAAVLVVVLLIVVYIDSRPQPVAVIASEVDTNEVDSPTAHFSQQQGQRHFSRNKYHHDRFEKQNYAAEPMPEKIFRKSAHVMVELNSADSMDLVQLYNIGPAFAKRILKYRARLGGFVEKSQLWEVYGMDSVRYNDIAPYVSVNIDGIELIDINSASVDQLKRHPYLDYYQAKAIVRMREQAGLYSDICDLKKVAIIDNETYNKILPYLTCNSLQNK